MRGVALVATAAALAACGGDDGGSGAATSTAQADAGSATTGAGTNAAFDQLVERAKEEGSVVFYTAEAQEVLDAYTKGFKDAYGIDVVVQPLTQGPMQERLAQEFASGNVQGDVAGNTLDIAWNEKAAAEGHLAPLDPEELPNVATHPDEHKGEHWVIQRLMPIGVMYNTDLVKEEDLPDTIAELASMADWKGRVAILDPQLGGSVHEWHYRLVQELGEPGYEKFIQGLVGDLDAIVSGAVSALGSQLGAGELAAVVGMTPTIAVPAINSGVPAKLYYPEPVTEYRIAHQALANGPHPNAAKLFINWLLSEEGAKASCGTGVCQHPQHDVEGQIEFPDTATFVDGREARKVGDEYVNGLVDSVANS
jgi:iron(III) transport system substrate-binding protein